MKHGHCTRSFKSPTYCSWEKMIHRTSHDHPYYGGRGITVCERWRTFTNFLADMGERPDGMTLDRIDGNGNYEPTNCRWATRKSQQRNTSYNHLLTVFGQTKCVAEWAEITGLRHSAITYRLRKGLSPEEAITRPHRVKVIARLLQRRAENARAWGKVWHTKPVAP